MVIVAQLVGGLPVAVAMALIAWGVLLTLLMQPLSQKLALLNLVVYAVLVGFTIASQAHAAQQGVHGRLNLLTLVDHLLAVALLVALVEYTLRRTLAHWGE